MLKAIRLYARAITGLNRMLFTLSATLMAIIVPVMMFEVVSRYVFNAPTTWGMELAILLFGPYFLLGGPYLLHLGGHVNLDLFHRRLAPKARRIMDGFHFIIIIMFCMILLYYAWPLAMQSFEYRETSFSAWNPPVWPYKFAVPAAVLLLALQSLAELMMLGVRSDTQESQESQESQA